MRRAIRYWYFRNIYRVLHPRKVVRIKFDPPNPSGEMFRVSDYGYLSIGNGWYKHIKLV